jgi:hypothetical protein
MTEHHRRDRNRCALAITPMVLVDLGGLYQTAPIGRLRAARTMVLLFVFSLFPTARRRVAGPVRSATKILAVLAAIAAACAKSHPPGSSGGSTMTCASAPRVAGADFCGACASNSKCSDALPISACCVWVEEPTVPAVRATGLHESSAAPGATSAVDVGCFAAPPPTGPSRTVTLPAT